jgi:hypothetical protein
MNKINYLLRKVMGLTDEQANAFEKRADRMENSWIKDGKFEYVNESEAGALFAMWRDGEISRNSNVFWQHHRANALKDAIMRQQERQWRREGFSEESIEEYMAHLSDSLYEAA